MQRNNGLVADIVFIGKEDYYIKKHNKITANLRLEIIEDSDSELNIRIYDPNQSYFLLPYKEPFPYTKVTKDSEIPNKYSYEIA